MLSSLYQKQYNNNERRHPRNKRMASFLRFSYVQLLHVVYMALQGRLFHLESV